MPVDTQLRSHMLFSENWAHFASLVDAATLYHTGTCAVDGSTLMERQRAAQGIT